MTTWGAGDYPLMARHLETAAGAAVEVAVVGPGDRVLDVATGTGNAALLAAQRGAQVVGVDSEPALLEVAEQRAAEAGPQIQWLTGDVTALPVPDGSADVVMSVFGVLTRRTSPRPSENLLASPLRGREWCWRHGRRAAPSARIADGLAFFPPLR